MDTNTSTVIIIALFAVVVIVALILFRNRIKANIQGPGGMGMGIDASNEQPLATDALQINDAKSRQGGLDATNETGGTMSVNRVEVDKDIKVTNKQPRKDGSPKA